MTQQNNTQNDALRYRTREEVEQFIFASPQSFREALEQSADMRHNFQTLLQTWNSADIMAVSWFLQSDPVRDPITGKKVLLENVAKDFSAWAHKEVEILQHNRFHSLGSFEDFHQAKEEMRIEMQNMNNKEKEQYIKETQDEMEHTGKRHADSLERKYEGYREEILVAEKKEIIKSIIAQQYGEMGWSQMGHNEFLMKLVPQGLYPDATEYERNIVGLLMLNNPEETIRRIKELAEKNEDLRQSLERHHVDVDHLVVQDMPQLLGAVAKIIQNKEVLGLSEGTVKDLLDDQTQNLFETAKQINIAVNVSAQEKEKLQDDLLQKSEWLKNHQENIAYMKQSVWEIEEQIHNQKPKQPESYSVSEGRVTDPALLHVERQKIPVQSAHDNNLDKTKPTIDQSNDVTALASRSAPSMDLG